MKDSLTLRITQRDLSRAVGWAGLLPMRFISRNIISMGKQVAHPTNFICTRTLIKGRVIFLIVNRKPVLSGVEWIVNSMAVCVHRS